MSAEHQEKYRLISLVEQGMETREIAAELDISVSKAARLVNQYNLAKRNNTIEQFVDVSDAVVGELIDNITNNAPKVIKDRVETAVEGVLQARDELQLLQDGFRVTANQLNLRIRQMAMTADHVDQIKVLSDSLCQLQTAFFNKQVTQVNVQNNIGGPGTSAGQNYGEFLSDKPKDN